MVLLKRKGKVYCFCRKPDDGQLMLQCDQCKEWYHGKCINITQEQADKLTRYYCATCKRRKNAQEKAQQTNTCLNNNNNNNSNNNNTLLPIPQSPAHNYPTTTTTTTTSTPTSPLLPSSFSQPSTPTTVYFNTTPNHNEELPHTKRQRGELEGGQQTPHSHPTSPHLISPSLREPWADLDNNERELFWETIRRSRGQA